ncbi:MAG: RtcB family protein, partial [Candidatus Poseidoniaceae archaeon]|nr:RtcB family protein [Candidatus Poseidoniaceae archaeon]
SWIMAGPANGQNIAFGSACHGAGRAMSRTVARKTIDPVKQKNELDDQGVIVHAATKNILSEEAPAAYKNVDNVIKNTFAAKLARPIIRLEPIAVIKG